MTAKEIRDKETSHLNAELLDRQKHLFDLRSQAVTEKLEDPSQLRKTKLDIARIKTVLRQRELDEEKKKAPTPAKSEAKTETKTAAKSATKMRKSAPTKRTRATKTETAKA